MRQPRIGTHQRSERENLDSEVAAPGENPYINSRHAAQRSAILARGGHASQPKYIPAFMKTVCSFACGKAFRRPFEVLLPLLLVVTLLSQAHAQTSPVKSNIPYVENGHEPQVLDIYAPPNAKNLPVAFWIHGGGWVTGDKGMAKMEGFLVTPFQGILALFLLDMGLLVSRNASQLKSFTVPLFAFAIYMPLASSAVGFGLALLIGLDRGTGFLFMVLCSSASYIAVPAALRLALPEANPAIALTLSLGVTFPFNLVFGIPLYIAAASHIAR